MTSILVGEEVRPSLSRLYFVFYCIFTASAVASLSLPPPLAMGIKGHRSKFKVTEPAARILKYHTQSSFLKYHTQYSFLSVSSMIKSTSIRFTLFNFVNEKKTEC